MKKTIMLLMSILVTFSVGLNLVDATTYTIDNSYITMPLDLYKDDTSNNTITVTGLTSPKIYYQIVKVSDNETLVSKIDNIYTQLKQLHEEEANRKKLTDGTDDATTSDALISSYKSSITSSINDANLKTLIDDPTEDFKELTSSTIPTSDLTLDDYYIVWVKVVDNDQTYYKYYPYKFIETSYYNGTKTVTNPDTGISNTLLYLGVGGAILLGSVLVIKKNKEIYE